MRHTSSAKPYRPDPPSVPPRIKLIAFLLILLPGSLIGYTTWCMETWYEVEGTVIEDNSRQLGISESHGTRERSTSRPCFLYKAPDSTRHVGCADFSSSLFNRYGDRTRATIYAQPGGDRILVDDTRIKAWLAASLCPGLFLSLGILLYRLGILKTRVD